MGSTGFLGRAFLEHLKRQIRQGVRGLSSKEVNLLSPDAPDKLGAFVDSRTILVLAFRSPGEAHQLQSFLEETTMVSNVARCLDRCPVRRLIYVSTLSVYGDTRANLRLTEKTPVAPTSFYGIAKWTGEQLLAQVAEAKKISWVILRPCKMYGPGDRSGAYGPMGFLEAALRSDTVGVFGDGLELRDHVFIEDMVRIIGQFAKNGHEGIYNVATGRSQTYRDILALVRKISGRSLRTISLKRNRPKINQRILPQRLLRVLPGFCFTPLEAGLVKTYQWLKST